MREPHRCCSRARLTNESSITILSRILLALYTLAVLAVVFWPTPIERPIYGEIKSAIDFAQQAGATGVSFNRVEFVSNIAMFLPLGALGVLAFPRVRWWLVPVAALAMSVLVELAQLVLISERNASVLDVLANTTGALIGAVVAWGIRARVRRRSGA